MPRKFLFCLLSHAALLALAAGICQAQFAPLATGTWLEDSQTPSCSPSAGWVSGGTCKHYTVSCGGIDDIGITVNYVAPQGTSNGTIVFFSQGGGESPSTTLGQEAAFASSYLGSHFGIVQTSWDSDWEAGGGSGSNSILTAGCRPATV